MVMSDVENIMKAQIRGLAMQVQVSALLRNLLGIPGFAAVV
jgi:hypothetical protein